MNLKIYQKYIYSNFIKSFISISFIFFFIVIIINFFEEIRFLEKYDTDFYFSIYLSILNAPSLMFEVFPFIFLITVKFFYLKLEENREMEILNSNGVSKLKIIYLLSVLSLIIGIISSLIVTYIILKLFLNFTSIKYLGLQK